MHKKIHLFRAAAVRHIRLLYAKTCHLGRRLADLVKQNRFIQTKGKGFSSHKLFQDYLGHILLATAVVLLAGTVMLHFSSKKTFQSADKRVLIKLPKRFSAQTANKDKLVVSLLPELSPQYVNLLAVTKNNEQIVYAYTYPLEKQSRQADLNELARMIKKDMDNNPQLADSYVQIQNRQQQVIFGAKNSGNATSFQESCLIKQFPDAFVTLCSRLKNENNHAKAKKLLATAKLQ